MANVDRGRACPARSIGAKKAESDNRFAAGIKKIVIYRENINIHQESKVHPQGVRFLV